MYKHKTDSFFIAFLAVLLLFTSASAFSKEVKKVVSRAVSSTEEASSFQASQCLGCHSAMGNEGQFSHFPYSEGMCSVCHQVQPEHMNGSTHRGVVTKNADQSCYSCHEARVDQNGQVHRALNDAQSCSNCHDPHGHSSRRYYIRNNLSTLCTRCHDVGLAGQFQSLHGIIRSERSCLECHTPHSSHQDHLLQSEPSSLCLSCHDHEMAAGDPLHRRTIPNIKRLVSEMPSVHAPARSGARGHSDSCTTCHNSHASPFLRLLTQNYPAGSWFAQYQEGHESVPNTYALCLRCHQNVLKDNPSALDTKFRNDTQSGNQVTRRNLHRLHVVELRSSASENLARTCSACHDPHGADQPHLIHSRVRFGRDFDLMIQFNSTSTTGQCTRSCHEPKGYRRIQ